MNKENFGNFIAEMRRELGMTQQALADQLHVTDKAVSKWERGLCYPDMAVLESLAAALDLTVAELMACKKHQKDTASDGCNDTQMRSLLKIANDSQKRQKKRICLFTSLLALAFILLTALIFLLAAANVRSSGYATFVGKKTNADGYFVYAEKGDRLLCLQCPNQQMYDNIEADRDRVYSIEYRWNRFTYHGTLYQCEAEDILYLGTPMDGQGSSIGIGSLLGFNSVFQNSKHVYPDPKREGKYLHSYCYYYRGGGTNYTGSIDSLQTQILTVEDCRSTACADYDGDGIVELFVLTKYDEEPYMLYEQEDGAIVSYFVDEVPADVLEQLKVGALDLT